MAYMKAKARFDVVRRSMSLQHREDNGNTCRVARAA